MKKKEILPFKEEKIDDYTVIRTFSENTNPDDLKWHWDEEHRWLEVKSICGWKFQFDNELPITLSYGKKIWISKGMYHRVIKGKGELVVKIQKMK